MPVYSTAADVFLRVRGLIGDGATAFTASTIPALTDVEGWLDEAAGILHVCLRGAGIEPIPQTDTIAIAKLGELEARYAVGMVRRTIAGFGGDQTNQDGQSEISSFYDECDEIRQRRTHYQEGLSPSTPILSAANYVQNPQGSTALTSDNWEPRFTKNQKF